MGRIRKESLHFGQDICIQQIQVLGDKFDKNVTVKQWLFIVGVSKFKEPPTVSEAANYVGYSRQNAKRLAAALKAGGYVTITKDKQDARALRIALTPKSVEYFSRRNQRELEFLNQIFDGLIRLTDGFTKV